MAGGDRSSSDQSELTVSRTEVSTLVGTLLVSMKHILHIKNVPVILRPSFKTRSAVVYGVLKPFL